MVHFLLQDNSNLKPLFIWGNDKYDVTQSKHPLNPNKELVLKDMNKVFSDIGSGFQELTLNNTLLIDDYPYKCVSNVPHSYLLGLLEAPSI